MGYSPDDLPEAMNDREKWRESVWDIRAGARDDDDYEDVSTLKKGIFFINVEFGGKV